MIVAETASFRVQYASIIKMPRKLNVIAAIAVVLQDDT